MEAQGSHTSVRSSCIKQAHFVYPRHSIGEVDGRVADIEDVYLGEDGSIQCVVAWRSSLIAIEHLAGGEPRRRCEQLFGERYGHQELQRRMATIKQTKKR